jgi:MscS family membrane protein
MDANSRTRTKLTICLLATLSAVVTPVTLAQAPPATSRTAGTRLDDDSPPQAQPERPLDLSNPRAAMQEFLLAIQDADADKPQRIDDAVRCLDISALEGDDVTEQARRLARRLHAVIRAKGVNLEDIPDDGTAWDYVFVRGEPAPGDATAPEIRLERDPKTDLWRFTPATLASLPALETALTAPTEASAASDVPATRRSPRAAMRTFLDAMNADPPDLAEAVKCLDPTGRDPEAWSINGSLLAYKLKNVMDKTKVVLLASIPDTSDGEPFEFYVHEKGSVVIGPVEEVSEPDAGAFDLRVGEWRFTPKTLATIDALFVEFEDQPILAKLREHGVQETLPLNLRVERLMPDFLRWEFHGFKGWNLLGLAIVLVLGWLIKRGAAIVAIPVGGALLRARKFDIDLQVQRRAFRSFGAVAMMAFWWCVIHQNYLLLPDWLLAGLAVLTTFGMAAAVGWFGYRIVDVLGGYIAANKELRLTQFDEVLVPLLRTILRFTVIVVVILFVLNLMGWRPTTVLGALGLGGLAVAFAAKDTLSNFFGSITVLTDRPFRIGDWIEVEGVNGTVEHVGFRSTRVRTFYNSVVTIPNSIMVNNRVDNYGARRYRRTSTTLGITYDTPPENIDAFCEGIRELIRLHPYTRKDYYHVYMSKFADSAFEIMLYVFFEVPDWGTELRERHRLYVDIIRLAKKLGVEFAFPTRTVWLEQPEKSAEKPPAAAIAAGQPDPEGLGIDQALKVFHEAYGEAPAPRGPVVVERTPRSKRHDKGDTGR